MAPAGQVIAVAPLDEDLPTGTARLRLSDRIGHEPFPAGDLNGDRKADLAVVSEGVVTVVFGGERREGSLEVAALLETGGASLISVAGNQEPGAFGAGDLDGDGIGDLVLYRPRLEVNVVRGRTSWPPSGATRSST